MADKIVKRSEIKTVEVFVDGGCPNNGKPDARGFFSFAVVVNGEVVRMVSKQSLVDEIGDGTKETNNVAEYVALISALRYIIADKNRAGLSYTLYTDSQLVYEQVLNKREAKKMIGFQSVVKDLMYSLDVKLVKVPRNQIVAVLGH